MILKMLNFLKKGYDSHLGSKRQEEDQTASKQVPEEGTG